MTEHRVYTDKALHASIGRAHPLFHASCVCGWTGPLRDTRPTIDHPLTGDANAHAVLLADEDGEAHEHAMRERDAELAEHARLAAEGDWCPVCKAYTDSYQNDDCVVCARPRTDMTRTR